MTSHRAFPLEPPLVRRLLHHEAEVHAVPGRDVRDIGDALLLHDPRDPEPFWNRLESVRFPSAPAAFDRRLAEIGILFATLARQPHIWLLPPYDEPRDVADRLRSNGFEDVGAGSLMATFTAEPSRRSLQRSFPTDVEVTAVTGLHGPAAEAAAASIAGVLVPAFGVGEARRPGIVGETLASLADPRFTHYVARLGGSPAAVARRATFDGISYLSSIGTLPAARGRGLGRLLAATATVDAFEAASEVVHLGVFVDNRPARDLYGSLGFAQVGEPGPDMILTG